MGRRSAWNGIYLKKHRKRRFQSASRLSSKTRTTLLYWKQNARCLFALWKRSTSHIADSSQSSKRWTASDSDMENRDKCPMCRRGFPPPNPALAWHQEFTEELQHLSNDRSLTGEQYAKRLFLNTLHYFNKLPASLANITSSSHPLNVATNTRSTDPENLVHWRAYFRKPTVIASHVRHFTSSSKHLGASGVRPTLLMEGRTMFSMLLTGWD
jgi:hypothetical protein